MSCISEKRKDMKTVKAEKTIRPDIIWLVCWLAGIVLLWIWNLFFLNAPALRQVQSGFLNTLIISCLVIIFSSSAAWLTANSLHYLESLRFKIIFHIFNFILNLLRSVPQIIGILFGYVLLTVLIQREIISGTFTQLCAMAAVLSIFTFLELHDLLLQRIDHFQQLDFCNAMRVCGIREFRIINQEILFSNSRAHILYKLIAIFGMAVFLQCSIDFIISVGLSLQLSPVNFPLTLGSLLAKIDSKQDILAIGYSLTNWDYIGNLFTRHLQGISVAFLIIYTLLCMHKISNAYAWRRQI
jgi:ABC-type methionine transport system permease subunit